MSSFKTGFLIYLDSLLQAHKDLSPPPLLPFPKMQSEWKQGNLSEDLLDCCPLYFMDAEPFRLLSGWTALKITWASHTGSHCEHLLPKIVKPGAVNTGEKRVQSRSRSHKIILQFLRDEDELVSL